MNAIMMTSSQFSGGVVTALLVSGFFGGFSSAVLVRRTGWLEETAKMNAAAAGIMGNILMATLLMEDKEGLIISLAIL